LSGESSLKSLHQLQASTNSINNEAFSKTQSNNANKPKVINNDNSSLDSLEENPWKQNYDNLVNKDYVVSNRAKWNPSQTRSNIIDKVLPRNGRMRQKGGADAAEAKYLNERKRRFNLFESA
jgi:hypothetical protein